MNFIPIDRRGSLRRHYHEWRIKFKVAFDLNSIQILHAIKYHSAKFHVSIYHYLHILPIFSSLSAVLIKYLNTNFFLEGLIFNEKIGEILLDDELLLEQKSIIKSFTRLLSILEKTPSTKSSKISISDRSKWSFERWESWDEYWNRKQVG